MTAERAKLKFVRFRDLQPHDINCDLQIHTTRTDGKADLESILQRAVEIKLDRIAITEHVRRDTTWFGEFANEIRQARGKYALEVLIGCEAKALDTLGGFDASDEIMEHCDIVLGSVHRFPNGEGGYIDYATLALEQFAQIEYELALGLLRTAPIDVLAHPGGMYSRQHGDFPIDLMRELLKASLERGIAVEISTSYLRSLPPFLDLCREINPFVSIGSDVHRLAELGNCRDRLRELGVGQA
jgi:putative hydrolase